MNTEKTVSHTKGSWIAEGKKVTSPDQRQFICDAAPHSVDKTEEAFANARLIAAAPELLEALEAAVSDLFYMVESAHGAKAASEHPSVIKGKLVISKAKGI